MTERALKLANQPHEFFHEQLTEAAASLKVDLDDNLRFYLINLMCDFVDPARVENPEEGGIDLLGTPLALIFKEALESPPSHRLRLLKRLGDTSLYFSGFFPDYFNTKTFDIKYYAEMGSSAYRTVSTIMRDQFAEPHFTSIYANLSARFIELADVLGEVAEAGHSAKRPDDILTLYDRWQQTASKRLQRKLERWGIVPEGSTKKRFAQ